MGDRDHAFLAPNYRMTEMQGAVGLAQLEKAARCRRATNRTRKNYSLN